MSSKDDVQKGQEQPDPEKGEQKDTPRTHAASKIAQTAAQTAAAAAWAAGRVLPKRPKHKLSKRGKMVEYDHEALLGWHALLVTSGTVFLHRDVYYVLPYVLSLALIMALLVYYGVPNAQRLNTETFQEFVVYFKVFISFMLGLFLNNSFRRWWSSVSSFKRFLTSIMQLVYTLHTVGLDDHLFDEIVRLCLASSFILSAEVHTAQITDKCKRKERWKFHLDELQNGNYITELERKDLDEDFGEVVSQDLGVRSTMIWMWIGEVMTNVQKEVAPPMYVRLLFLCHDCMSQVEALKTNLSVQLPFTYAHMLAVLVHLANIMLAISCGLAIGSSMAETMVRSQEVENGDHSRHMLREFYQAVQVSGMQLVFLVVQPMIYQSFLAISHALCYPFGEDMCHLPMEFFIESLENQIRVMAKSKGLHRHALTDA